MEEMKKLCVEIFWIASGEFLAFLGDKVTEWGLDRKL